MAGEGHKKYDETSITSPITQKAISGDFDYDTLKDLTRDINLGRLADGLSILSESALSFQAELLKLQDEFQATQKRADELGFTIGDKLQEQLGKGF